MLFSIQGCRVGPPTFCFCRTPPEDNNHATLGIRRVWKKITTECQLSISIKPTVSRLETPCFDKKAMASFNRSTVNYGDYPIVRFGEICHIYSHPSLN